MPWRRWSAFLGVLGAGCGYVGYEVRPAIEEQSVEPEQNRDGSDAPRSTDVEVPPTGAPGLDGDETPAALRYTDAMLQALTTIFVDPDTLVFFHFDPVDPHASLNDETRLEPVELRDGPADSIVDGPESGAMAREFDWFYATLMIPDEPRWQLDEGSVDFYLRPRRCAPDSDGYGLVVRDAQGQSASGHIRVFLESTCEICVRVQSTTAEHTMCSAPLALDTWRHVGINFGAEGLDLWVDGEVASQDPWPAGIAGNNNVWVVGGSNGRASEGSSRPTINAKLEQVDLTLVRISRVRRDFSDVPFLN